MSLVSIDLALGDTGTFEPPAKAEYVHRFVGRSNNPFDNPLSIARDRLCPRPGGRDPFDPRAFINSVQPERRDGTALVWDITVQSSTEFEPDEEENPLNRPAKITPASEQTVITTRRNARGEWIRNAAGTIIPLEKKQSLWLFNVEKNVPFIPTFIMNMNETVNAGTVFLKGLVIPRHKLMVSGIRGEPQETRFRGQTLEYLTMFFQLAYNRDGYKVKFPNVDLVQLVREKLIPERDSRGRIVRENDRVRYQRFLNARVPILDADGQPVTEPWPLDRQGRALPRDYRESDLVENEEEVYEATSFDQLPLR